MSKRVKQAEKQAKKLRRTLAKLQQEHMGFTQHRETPTRHAESIIAWLRAHKTE